MVGRNVELLLPAGSLTRRVYNVMDLINRSAVIVMPAELFLKWLHRADSTSTGLTLEDLTRISHTGLVSREKWGGEPTRGLISCPDEKAGVDLGYARGSAEACGGWRCDCGSVATH
jgi:hypothetical protein